MRVHHIINGFALKAGGAEKVVRLLHAGLRRRGVDSFVFGVLAQPQADEMPNSFSLELKSPYGWGAFNGVRHYVAENVRQGDIVHAHLFPTILYLSILKKIGLLNTTLVCTEHSTSNRRRGSLSGRFIDTLSYAGYDRVIAISSGAEVELLAWKPDLNGKTTVVQNGVELCFKQLVERQDKEILVVLSVGRICAAKNYVNALSGVALLNDIEFEYQIAGSGEGLEGLLQLCKNLGIESKVHFLGHVDDINTLLASADIFLMPSRWEGFGLATVEAMNASLPVVVSDIPGLREVVSHSPPCAILVDPESPESIADAIRDLLGSHQNRLELGISAFKHSLMFSEERMVELYLKLYTELLGTIR